MIKYTINFNKNQFLLALISNLIYININLLNAYLIPVFYISLIEIWLTPLVENIVSMMPWGNLGNPGGPSNPYGSNGPGGPSGGPGGPNGPGNPIHGLPPSRKIKITDLIDNFEYMKSRVVYKLELQASEDPGFHSRPIYSTQHSPSATFSQQEQDFITQFIANRPDSGYGLYLVNRSSRLQYTAVANNPHPTAWTRRTAATPEFINLFK